MIRRRRADTFVYRLYCDHCSAEMKALNHPPLEGNRFVHQCEGCDHQERIANVKYPLIDTVEINEEAMNVPNSPTPKPDAPPSN